MKNLNKLEINSEKLVKNEELLTLRGGYGLNGHCCYCANPFGAMAPGTWQECQTNCSQLGGYYWYC